MKKLGPPLILLFIGLCFWWFDTNPTEPQKSSESVPSQIESVPSQILTTWTTGKNRTIKLTLYEASSGGDIQGFFFKHVSGKSGKIDGMVKGRYRDNALKGYWFNAVSKQQCAYKRFGTLYWGRLDFEFGEGSFTGKWGSCDNQLNKEWNGALG